MALRVGPGSQIGNSSMKLVAPVVIALATGADALQMNALNSRRSVLAAGAVAISGMPMAARAVGPPTGPGTISQALYDLDVPISPVNVAKRLKAAEDSQLAGIQEGIDATKARKAAQSDYKEARAERLAAEKAARAAAKAAKAAN